MSEFSARLDAAITPIRTVLAMAGFRERKRIFNRKMGNGIIHVVQVRMGLSTPPGTPEVPGFQRDWYGTFSIDVGVYIPEVAERLQYWKPIKSFPGEMDCCIRQDLGELFPEGRSLSPPVNSPASLYAELAGYVTKYALPFFEQHADRPSIVSRLRHGQSTGSGGRPRVVAAIILCAQGSLDEARELLQEQHNMLERPDQRSYVKELGEQLGIW